MTFIKADSLSLFAFTLMALALFTAYSFWLKNDRNWLLTYSAFTFIFSLTALTGFSKTYPIPTLPLLMLFTMIFAFCFAFSKTGKLLTDSTSLLILVGIQGFRFPLELILHQWAEIGTIPNTMTWTGSNPDIIAGLLALFFLPLVMRNEKLAWIPQIIGSLLLINVVRVVIMSSPFPFSWNLENPLQLGIYFPYVLIVPIFVLPALIAHLLTFRKLLSK